MLAAAATAGPSAYWYLTRGTGAVSLILLTLSVTLGVANVRRARTEHIPRFVFDAVHGSASLLAVAFVVVHVVTSLLDGYVPIRVVDVVVPFLSPYRPLWLGLGAVAFDLLIAVVVTSVLRRRFGHRAWRTTIAGLPSWPVALLHGFGTGTDTKASWMLLLTGACVISVIAAVLARATAGWPEHPAARLTAIAASAIVPVGLLVWLPSGPLAAGWPRRAGTPASLLASARSSTSGASRASGSSNSGTAAPAGATAFNAQVTGTVKQRQSHNGLANVDISLSVSRQPLSTLRIRIAGQPIAGGGVEMTSSRVTLGPASNPDLYRGRITALQGTAVEAVVSDANGTAITLASNLQIDPGSGSVTGAVSARPAQAP